MVKELLPGRNDLYRFMEMKEPLEEILVKGRFLESSFHDSEGCENDHMHWYRKVLSNYNPETETVLLSKKGSRRLLDSLDEPEKEFTRKELYEEALRMDWKVRPANRNLF